MAALFIGLIAGFGVFMLLSPGSPPGRPTRLSRLYAQLGAVPSAKATVAQRGLWVRKLPVQPVVRFLRQILSERYAEKARRQLRISRLDSTYTYEDFLGMKVAAALVCGLYALMMYAKGRDWMLGAFMLGLTLMAFVYPDVWLAAKARRMQDQIRRDLPAFLSALAVALEAGLSLMPAIAEVTRDRQGALATELCRAADLYERGATPGEALERVALRLEVSELTVTLTGLHQAFSKGAGHVVETVRNQASEAWRKRKGRAEALAQTASIKLFLPIAMLALPGFMIFLLGPAVLEVIDYFLR